MVDRKTKLTINFGKSHFNLFKSPPKKVTCSNFLMMP